MSDKAATTILIFRNSILTTHFWDHPDAIAEPPVDPQLEYLPTDRLSWENFERLLVRDEDAMVFAT